MTCFYVVPQPPPLLFRGAGGGGISPGDAGGSTPCAGGSSSTSTCAFLLQRMEIPRMRILNSNRSTSLFSACVLTARAPKKTTIRRRASGKTPQGAAAWSELQRPAIRYLHHERNARQMIGHPVPFLVAAVCVVSACPDSTPMSALQGCLWLSGTWINVFASLLGLLLRTFDREGRSLIICLPMYKHASRCPCAREALDVFFLCCGSAGVVELFPATLSRRTRGSCRSADVIKPSQIAILVGLTCGYTRSTR